MFRAALESTLCHTECSSAPPSPAISDLCFSLAVWRYIAGLHVGSSSKYFPCYLIFIYSSYSSDENLAQAIYICGVRGWLRHCATSRKFAGSIPDGVIGIFHWHNPSGRTVGLGSTQLLTEMSSRRRPARRSDILTAIMCRLSWNLGASNSLNPQGLSRPVMGLLQLYIHFFEVTSVS